MATNPSGPLIFHGYSDDTFGEYGRTDEDHDNCANGKPIRFLVASGTDRLVVVGQYAAGGAWRVGVEPFENGSDEGAPIPPWPIAIRASVKGETPYSPTLVIDAPADAIVEHLPERERAR